MSDDKTEYKKQLDEYMKAEYQRTNPKPRGMFGNWGWYAVKKREFDEKWKDNEKVLHGSDTQADNKK